MNKLALLLLPLFVAGPAFAGGPRVRHRQVHYEERCYKNVEKYTPGYYNSHGTYMRGRVTVRRKEVPCRRIQYVPQVRPNRYYEDSHPNVGGRVDDNSCIEGSILGGILGGGAGAAASRGDGRLWAIPLGIVGGAMVGCQVDGG